MNKKDSKSFTSNFSLSILPVLSLSSRLPLSLSLSLSHWRSWIPETEVAVVSVVYGFKVALVVCVLVFVWHFTVASVGFNWNPDLGLICSWILWFKWVLTPTVLWLRWKKLFIYFGERKILLPKWASQIIEKEIWREFFFFWCFL